MLQQTKEAKKQYKKMVEQASPNSSVFANSLKAFLVGGLICDLGQLVKNICVSRGVPQDRAAMYTSVILIFLGVLLTGMGVYDKIGKFAGAGSVVPITGFANSVAAPAIEYKKEGFIMGMGAKMFLVAGPVIVYGTLAATVVGLIYWLVK
ncbi:MAG: stage V sporulation protein AC [Defluviitaleaceae bacterium]|nr:stage V sporulation protein AC [Defluviitaleaceae bacterium]